MLQQLVYPLGHLRRGFVGEGDSKDGVRRHIAHLDQVGDAVGDDARLARAGAGEDEQGAIYGFNGGSLLRI